MAKMLDLERVDLRNQYTHLRLRHTEVSRLHCLSSQAASEGLSLLLALQQLQLQLIPLRLNLKKGKKQIHQ